MACDLCIVVARAENAVIGCNNRLPWRLPKDLQYFKAVTMGHPIIMGRKTYDSIGRPLPGRPNIVVTRQSDWSAEGVIVKHSLDDALAVAGTLCTELNVSRIMLIGGANLYEQAFARCKRLYLTEVHARVAGDTYFPDFDRTEWQELARESHQADDSNPYDYSFVVMERMQ